MELADRAARLSADGRTPGLGTLLVGDNSSSARYVEMKIEECKEVGIRSFDEHLPASATQAEIEAVVDRFNADPHVHSILVQLPLPDGINEEEVLLRVSPAKDVDGLHPTNLGRLVMGAPGPLPCTPNGIVELLAEYRVPVEGKHVVIIGRGLTIGRPLGAAARDAPAELQRRRDGRAHRREGHWGPDAHGGRHCLSGRGCPASSPPTWSRPARRWSGPGPRSRARSY